LTRFINISRIRDVIAAHSLISASSELVCRYVIKQREIVVKAESVIGPPSVMLAAHAVIDEVQ